VDWIISHKDLLPEEVVSSLSKTFAPKSANTISSWKKRFQKIERKHIQPSESLLTYISGILRAPQTFWNLNLLPRTDYNFMNIVQRLYRQTRSIEESSVIYRAFFTTGIHLFLETICKNENATYLTPRIISHCAYLILGQYCNTRERKQIGDDLKRFNEVGSKYNGYAVSLGGHGYYFLAAQLDSWCLERRINHEERSWGVSHLIRIGVLEIVEQLELNKAAEVILQEIKDQFQSCIHIPNNRKRKRDLSNIELPSISDRYTPVIQVNDNAPDSLPPPQPATRYQSQQYATTSDGISAQDWGRTTIGHFTEFPILSWNPTLEAGNNTQLNSFDFLPDVPFDSTQCSFPRSTQN